MHLFNFILFSYFFGVNELRVGPRPERRSQRSYRGLCSMPRMNTTDPFGQQKTSMIQVQYIIFFCAEAIHTEWHNRVSDKIKKRKKKQSYDNKKKK